MTDPKSHEPEPDPPGKSPEVEEDSVDEEIPEDDALFGALSSLRSVPAPPPPTKDFGDAVEDRIRRRSGGKFFAERSFTERVSVGVLALVIIAVGLGVYWLIRDSDTGSLKLDKGGEVPRIAPGARDAVPKPYNVP